LKTTVAYATLVASEAKPGIGIFNEALVAETVQSLKTDGHLTRSCDEAGIPDVPACFLTSAV